MYVYLLRDSHIESLPAGFSSFPGHSRAPHQKLQYTYISYINLYIFIYAITQGNNIVISDQTNFFSGSSLGSGTGETGAMMYVQQGTSENGNRVLTLRLAQKAGPVAEYLLPLQNAAFTVALVRKFSDLGRNYQKMTI